MPHRSVFLPCFSRPPLAYLSKCSCLHLFMSFLFLVPCSLVAKITPSWYFIHIKVTGRTTNLNKWIGINHLTAGLAKRYIYCWLGLERIQVYRDQVRFWHCRITQIFRGIIMFRQFDWTQTGFHSCVVMTFTSFFHQYTAKFDFRTTGTQTVRVSGQVRSMPGPGYCVGLGSCSSPIAGWKHDQPLCLSIGE